MAEASPDTRNTSAPDRPPAAPALLSPREAAVVDGNEVTFSWRGVDGADEYILQVGTTASFDRVVFERNLGDETGATIADFFPTDEQTFFWRVLARNDAGIGGEQRVESFVAAAPEAADQQLGVPEGEEEMGPVTELVRAARQEISATMLDTKDRFEREKEQGVAYEGIATGQIMSIAVSILLVIAVAVVIVFNWTLTRAADTAQATVDPDNYTQLREARLEATQRLEGYDVVDEEEGVYRIPIDRAMDIVANEEYQRQQQDAPDQ
jgi:hypothetical protein